MRKTCRAIIFKDNKLALMYRKKAGRVYYTLPGGKIDEDESMEECVVRECYEELGITIKPIKHTYRYEDLTAEHDFFLCEWINGEYGTGKGEEFEHPSEENIYRPILVDISKLVETNIVPIEVKESLLRDLEKYGTQLGDELEYLYSNFGA